MGRTNFSPNKFGSSLSNQTLRFDDGLPQLSQHIKYFLQEHCGECKRHVEVEGLKNDFALKILQILTKLFIQLRIKITLTVYLTIFLKFGFQI